MAKAFPYRPTDINIALELDDYYVWDCSVLYSGGKYHMFSSRWPKKLGFGANWLFNSQIIHSVSDTPEGPYRFRNVVFERRGRQYFDGMNTHNTCIKEFEGKFYLYYMGCSYPFDIPTEKDTVTDMDFVETWNRKRIGVAVADDINGEFIRRDQPILEPRDCSHWDCTNTTNPSVAILPSGKTYMIYKSRMGNHRALKLGVAVADRPEGPFTRLSDDPIFQFDNPDFHIEDPFLWYDENRKKFCLIAKDDCKNGSTGITGHWGGGFYAESDDCIHFEIPEDPEVYSRTVRWTDGTMRTMPNLERVSLLFDENGVPTHMYHASGHGDLPYTFEDGSYIVCQKLVKQD